MDPLKEEICLETHARSRNNSIPVRAEPSRQRLGVNIRLVAINLAFAQAANVGNLYLLLSEGSVWEISFAIAVSMYNREF